MIVFSSYCVIVSMIVNFLKSKNGRKMNHVKIKLLKI